MTDEIVWSPRLGARLEASRVQAGKRRLELAAQLGVSEETIRLWEKGSVQPSVERLARLIALMSLEAKDWASRSEPATADGKVKFGLRKGRKLVDILPAE